MNTSVVDILDGVWIVSFGRGYTVLHPLSRANSYVYVGKGGLYTRVSPLVTQSIEQIVQTAGYRSARSYRAETERYIGLTPVFPWDNDWRVSEPAFTTPTETRRHHRVSEPAWAQALARSFRAGQWSHLLSTPTDWWSYPTQVQPVREENTRDWT